MVEMQRAPIPEQTAMLVPADSRFYRSVRLDYVAGMSEHSYLFAEANQSAYRPLLNDALIRSGMYAPTDLAARYLLQVDFRQLSGGNVGTDIQSRSSAVYRIVSRQTGEVVFEAPVDAAFLAIFPGLNEEDAETAFLRSIRPWEALNKVAGAAIFGEAVVVEYLANNENARDALGIDTVTEATQDEWNTAWRRYYQASAWTLLWGPVTRGLEFINPLNYWARPDFYGLEPGARPRGAVNKLAQAGIGARDGLERGRQADYQMMAQSITKFAIAVAEKEQFKFVTRLPCSDNRETVQVKADLSARGYPWMTDDCRAYRSINPVYGYSY